MTEEDLTLMRECIERAVKETVNGKIAALDTKLSQHMERVEPYLEAFTLGRGFVKWLVGAVIALGTIVLLVKQIFFQP